VFTLWVLFLRVAAFMVTEEVGSIHQKGVLMEVLVLLQNIPWLSFLLSTLFFLIQSFLFLRICDEYNVMERPGLSVFFFLGLYSALFPSNLGMGFIQLGATFVLMSWLFFYRFIKEGYSKPFLFLSAFFLGVSGLCIPDFYWSIIFLLILIPVFKTISAADVLVIVFAMIMPYYLLSSLGYLLSTNINFSTLLGIWRESASLSRGFEWTEHVQDVILLANLLLVSLFGVIKVLSSYYRFNVETRRSRLAMSLISAFVFLICVFQYDEYDSYFYLLGFPISLYTATVFNIENPSRLVKFLFWVYILLLMAYPFRLIIF
jgi:hypothetical protein